MPEYEQPFELKVKTCRPNKEIKEIEEIPEVAETSDIGEDKDDISNDRSNATP